jgi:hypothetical protein
MEINPVTLISAIAACFAALFSGATLYRSFRSEKPFVFIDNEKGYLLIVNKQSSPIIIESVSAAVGTLQEKISFDDYYSTSEYENISGNLIKCHSVVAGKEKVFLQLRVLGCGDRTNCSCKRSPIFSSSQFKIVVS